MPDTINFTHFNYFQVMRINHQLVSGTQVIHSIQVFHKHTKLSDLESEVPGSILTEDNILLLELFIHWHIVDFLFGFETRQEAVSSFVLCCWWQRFKVSQISVWQICPFYIVGYLLKCQLHSNWFSRCIMCSIIDILVLNCDNFLHRPDLELYEIL